MFTLFVLGVFVGNAFSTGVKVGDLVYSLNVKTSSWFWSGTDNTVSIQLQGDVTTAPWLSYSGENDRFERNSHDHLRYSSKNVGHLTKVNAKLIKVDSFDRWKLDYVDVSINSSMYRAYFYKTFYHDQKVYSSNDIKVVFCAAGYEKIDLGRGVEICQDIDECKTTCKQRGMICKNFPGDHTCSCQAGLEMADGRCQDIDECHGDEHTCSEIVNTECVNVFGSYECRCQDGYHRNRNTGLCEDINECERHLHDCHQTCENTNGAFQCGCNKGWRLTSNNRTCTDADECTEGENPCDPETSECYDLRGSYLCICKHGYKQIPQTQKCEPVTCKALHSQAHMLATPSGCHLDDVIVKGETCSISCEEGYELAKRSARSFVCTKNGEFKMGKNLYEPRCIPKLCPKIKQPENGMVVPYSCSTTGMHHGGKCSFYCRGGYKLYGDAIAVSCINTKYSPSPFSNQTVCAKVPEISCPGDITLRLPADSGKAHLGMHFQGPSTNMEQYETNPKNVDSEYGFGIGRHSVEYIARNKYGDVAKCSYRINVVDTEPPVKVFCPQDMFYQVKSQERMMISWPEPVFKDNVEVKRTRQNVANGKLHLPTSFNVIYDAYDEMGNVATCQFQVHIELKTCSFNKIKGGDKSINNACFNLGNRYLCSLTCPKGKTLDHIPEGLMMKGRWFCEKGDWIQQEKILQRLPDCVDFTPNPTNGDCNEGSVKTFDLLTHQRACGKCPRGTRYHEGVCLPCSKHHYQDVEGQMQCKKCPTGKGSVLSRNKDVGDCIELCKPGTYSKTGMPGSDGKCTKCPKNTFNDEYGSIECNRCPFGTMTELIASNNKDLCIVIKDKIFPIPETKEVEIKGGEDRQIGCLVNSRKNVEISWQLPNGIRLGPNTSIETTSRSRPTLGQIRNCTQYISTLHFKTTSKEISGKYSCAVKYQGRPDEESYAFEVSVKYE